MKVYVLIILTFLLSNISSAQNKEYTNLVFEGAGIKGIAYSGVIKQLEIYQIIDDIEKVGGTSAGAITALMVSIGYNADEIYQIISDLKFQKFNDGGLIFFGGSYRMKNRYGWYKSKAFEKWLDKIITAKTGNGNITFKELELKGFKELHVTATCLNRQQLMILSSKTYPNMKIKDAVKISMSIPLYFEACFVDSLGNLYKNFENKPNLDIMIDGGIIGNFPIDMFDEIALDSSGKKLRIPNPKTLGIRIDTDEQIVSDLSNQGLVSYEISDFRSYIVAFYTFVLENLNRGKLNQSDWERTISVSSVGIGPKIRRLRNDDKLRLMQSGEKAVVEFFTK